MEFWASEVKSGESFKVQPGEGMVLHLSQASLGESKKEKGSESVCVYVNVDGKKLVLGTLFSDKLPQQQFDLVFDRDFELSHNWKNGSVYFYGYMAANPFDDEDEGEEFESESEEDIPLTVENGKPLAKAKEEKPADAKKAKAQKESAAGKQKVKIVEPILDSSKKEEEDNDSSDEDESMSEDEDDSDMDEDEDESDSDDEDEDDDSDEETPKKVETGKKRSADSEIKTPVPDKKAKLATPQKTDGKKGGHVATPHPSKQATKTPGNKNQQTPKSGGGSHTCKSCSRSFGSENALESHTKAKHSAGK